MLTSKEMHDQLEKEIYEGLISELPKIMTNTTLLDQSSSMIHEALLQTAQEKLHKISKDKAGALVCWSGLGLAWGLRWGVSSCFKVLSIRFNPVFIACAPMSSFYLWCFLKV